MSPIAFRRKAIRCEKSLGERLEAAREQLKVTLDEAEHATRVRAKYLYALEAGQYQVLPEDVYTLGFVQRYARYLGLELEAVLTQYRTERLAAERLQRSAQKQDTQTVVRPLREQRLFVTPKLFWSLSSVAIVAVVAGYLWYQIHGFMAAPPLEIAQATPEMVVSTPSIEIRGQTDGYAFVTINAEPVTIDPDGSFSQEVKLEPGMNTIQVAARNRLNKETKRELRVLAQIE